MSQRTAHMDLDWVESHSTSPSGYDYVQYRADLPPIPGHQGPFHVTVLEQRHLPLSDVPYYEFVVTYDGLPDPVGTVSNEDFSIPNSDSAEEMMQAVENLSPQEIADALTAIGDVPLYGDDFAASRKASRRTASLGLDWEKDGDDYVAQLPAIPGYPEMHDEESLVYVAPVGDEYTFWMEIAVLKSEFIKLTDLNFNLPNASSADEMMQEVDSLTIQDILDALSAVGCGPIDATASRKTSIEHEGRMFHKEGKHMIRKATKRKADMDLDWKPSDAPGFEWEAELPAIPGYTNAPGDAMAYVRKSNYAVDDGYVFWLSVGVPGDSPWMISNFKLDIGNTDTADEMMEVVDELDPEWIADHLVELGYPTIDATASRHATRRIASLDLDWEETTDTFGDPLYKAVLPAIPGYPYSGDGNSTVSIGLDTYESEPGDEMYTWWMDIQVGKNDNVRFGDYELTGMGSYPLDYEMGYIDGLSVEWIADKLAEKGYMPEED